MESSKTEILERQLACELLPTTRYPNDMRLFFQHSIVMRIIYFKCIFRFRLEGSIELQGLEVTLHDDASFGSSPWRLVIAAWPAGPWLRLRRRHGLSAKRLARELGFVYHSGVPELEPKPRTKPSVGVKPDVPSALS